MRRLTAALVALGGWALARPALAGDFDAKGRYLPDPKAVAFLDFGAGFDLAKDYYTPPENPPECKPGSTLVDAADALAGERLLHVNLKAFGCADRFVLRGVPPTKSSYRATVWFRHGGIDAQLTAVFRPESGLPTRYAKLGPTGRTTSDGWVEYASNDLPIDGAALETLYMKLSDYDTLGSDVDAIELVESGEYVEPAACKGATDPVCGSEGVCRAGRCVLGRLHVPPLPDAAVRDQVVDRMRGLLTVFFGGRKTRVMDLPRALEQLEAIRTTSSAWAFWNGFALAIRELHDWHTRAYGDIQYAGGWRRLNVCFIAGDADASLAIAPRHPLYDDVLVSHVGTTGTGLKAGDRIVAVDGLHPIEWALGLKGVDWGWWQASDDRVFAEPIERLGELIGTYAGTVTYLSCHADSGTCDPKPKLLTASTLGDGAGGVACDNRPFYPLVSGNPPANHDVGYKFYEGVVQGTTAEEKIRGLVWDTLYGGGDPNGYVNASFKKYYSFFKANARGVLLDHRAGNGGTLDGAESATALMRPLETVLVFRSPIESAGFEGPATPEEGLALFKASQFKTPYQVGSANHDPNLPVALLLHRDGSASDFFPFGIKGAPKVRIFGAGPTAGAFSTYYSFDPPGPLAFQIASGDSISAAGDALIGHGVDPDVVVLQRQSDLLAGRDTMVQAALAWLRQELKP